MIVGDAVVGLVVGLLAARSTTGVVSELCDMTTPTTAPTMARIKTMTPTIMFLRLLLGLRESVVVAISPRGAASEALSIAWIRSCTCFSNLASSSAWTVSASILKAVGSSSISDKPF